MQEKMEIENHEEVKDSSPILPRHQPSKSMEEEIPRSPIYTRKLREVSGYTILKTLGEGGFAKYK